MIYRLVGDMKSDNGIVPSSGYPYAVGDDAVCVYSDYPADFVKYLIARVTFDFNEARARPRDRYYRMGMSKFAEILRDFFGFGILDTDPASASEGMTVCPWALCARLWSQSRFLVQCSHVLDRDGLDERFAEIYGSVIE